VTALANLPTVLLFKGAETAAPGDTDALIWGVAMMVVSIILVVVLSTLSQAVVLYGAFQDMRGRRVDLKESMQVGLRRFFPILGLAFCMALLGGLGFVLLIVPGLFLLTIWAVGVPAIVVERAGVIEAFGRSHQLVRGHGWTVFGAIVVAFLILWGLGFAAIVIGAAIGDAAGAIILAIIVNILAAPFAALISSVLFFELRGLESGSAAPADLSPPPSAPAA
jgi:hypothetical protein